MTLEKRIQRLILEKKQRRRSLKHACKKTNDEWTVGYFNGRDYECSISIDEYKELLSFMSKRKR